MRCSGVDFAHEKASCILVGPRLPHTEYWDQVRSAVTDVQACSTLAKEQRGIEKRKDVLKLLNDILNPQFSLADCSKTRIKGALSELEYSVHCLDHPESIELLDSLINLNWTPEELPELLFQVISLIFIIGSIVIPFSTYWFLCSFWINTPMEKRYHTLADCIRRRELPEDFNTLYPGLRLIFFYEPASR